MTSLSPTAAGSLVVFKAGTTPPGPQVTWTAGATATAKEVQVGLSDDGQLSVRAAGATNAPARVHQGAEGAVANDAQRQRRRRARAEVGVVG